MTSQKLIISSVLVLVALVCIEFTFITLELFGYAPHIGIALHLLGGCCSGLLLYGFGLESLKKTPILIQMLFVLGSVALAAVLWEGFEWGVGKVLHENMQVSLNNTMQDLFMGMMGGFLACVVVWFIQHKK